MTGHLRINKRINYTVQRQNQISQTHVKCNGTMAAQDADGKTMSSAGDEM